MSGLLTQAQAGGARVAAGAQAGHARFGPARRARPPAAGATRRRGAADLTVRRIARAVEDGFESDLVPGIRASADAALLAQELAFAAARLDELRAAPPGLLGEAAALGRDGRREEALWLVAQVAAIGPREAWQADPRGRRRPRRRRAVRA